MNSTVTLSQDKKGRKTLNLWQIRSNGRCQRFFYVKLAKLANAELCACSIRIPGKSKHLANAELILLVLSQNYREEYAGSNPVLDTIKDIAVMQLEPRTHRAGAESKAGGQQNTYLDIKTVMSSSLGSLARERVVLALIFNIEELYCGGSLATFLISSGSTYRVLAEIQGEQTKTSTDKKVGATSKLTTPDLQDPYADFLCVLIVFGNTLMRCLITGGLLRLPRCKVKVFIIRD